MATIKSNGFSNALWPGVSKAFNSAYEETYPWDNSARISVLELEIEELIEEIANRMLKVVAEDERYEETKEPHDNTGLPSKGGG